MVRQVMVIMGLLAFAITLFGGAITDNSFEFTITRGLWAMLTFSGIGLVLGWCTKRVVREYRAQQFLQILGHKEGETPPPPEDDGEIHVAQPPP